MPVHIALLRAVNVGIGRSKLTVSLIEKQLNSRGTCRNWNTTLRLLALTEGQSAKSSTRSPVGNAHGKDPISLIPMLATRSIEKSSAGEKILLGLDRVTDKLFANHHSLQET